MNFPLLAIVEPCSRRLGSERLLLQLTSLSPTHTRQIIALYNIFFRIEQFLLRCVIAFCSCS
jgi:hypothetical protein